MKGEQHFIGDATQKEPCKELEASSANNHSCRRDHEHMICDKSIIIFFFEFYIVMVVFLKFQ